MTITVIFASVDWSVVVSFVVVHVVVVEHPVLAEEPIKGSVGSVIGVDLAHDLADAGPTLGNRIGQVVPAFAGKVKVKRIQLQLQLKLQLQRQLQKQLHYKLQLKLQLQKTIITNYNPSTFN